MNLRTTVLLGSCAILLSSLRARAQDVAVVPPGGAAVVTPAAPAGPNLFSMILPTPEMRERCRQKLCKCELVKLMKASLAGPSALSGGIIPVGNCCPTIKKEDLLKPADSAEGAAARILADAAGAAERRKAVRLLGTVDCRYWPEAEDGLINALRADKIECVRYEAALQLQRGCCCTKKIAKALTIVIEGSDKDGFPAERSCRVKDAAAIALSMCCFEDKVEPKEPPEGEKKRIGKVDPKDFYKNAENASNDAVFANARKALENRGSMTSTQVLQQNHRAQSQGLFGMLGHAFESSNDQAEPTREPAPVVAAAPQPQPQQPQRRGLFYKLFPNEEQQTVYVPPTPSTTIASPTPKSTPVTTAQPVGAKWQPLTSSTNSTPTTNAPAVIKTQPSGPAVLPPVTTAPQSLPPISSATPQRLPVGDIRPVSYTTPPLPAYRGPSKIDEPPFSTAAPTGNSAPRPTYPTSTYPTPTSSNATPTPTQTQSQSQPQGQLGFVLFSDDQPTRR